MRDRYDVVVVGADSAGSAAAISAARFGASLLLVDRLAFMGGTSTAVLDTFHAFYDPERPLRVVGLLVAGRCFSATHDAHASARSMATCMAMGQAAGTAAVFAAAGGTVPRAVPADALRERLALDGALLEPAVNAAGQEAPS